MFLHFCSFTGKTYSIVKSCTLARLTRNYVKLTVQGGRAYFSNSKKNQTSGVMTAEKNKYGYHKITSP